MADLFLDHAWQWLMLVVLLLCSGFLSGSETALFSLTQHELHVFRRSSSRTQRLAAELMAGPRRMLATVLIGNNTVNVLIFATSYVLIRQVGLLYGPAAASLGGVASLLIVVIFGEVIPKVIASAGAVRFAPIVAPVLHGFQWAISPVRILLEVAFVEPLLRLIGRPPLPGMPVTPEELKTLLDISSQEGAIEPGESTWLQQVVDLAEARVHEVMVPRVDVVAFDITRPVDELIELYRRTHLLKIPAFEGDLDHVVGVLYARDVVPEPEIPLRGHLRRVRFVPEQMRLEQLLRHFRQTRTQLAIVVDEYGGAAGLVTLEDMLEHVVGELRDEDLPPSRPDVEALDDGVTFSVAGRLSVRALAQAMGPAVLDDRVDTLAGLFYSKFGRVPRVGDQVHVGNLVLTVESMADRRIDRIQVRLDDGAPAGEGAG